MSVLDVIKRRSSIRKYLSREIPPVVMERLLESIRLAPSACNYQPWRFILVAEDESRKQVAATCGKQMWMAEAPLIIVGCGLPQEAYQFMGGYGNSIDVDVSIAMDHLTLVATEEGLGTCWIGSFDEKVLKKILKIPDHAKIVALTPVGYPADKKAQQDLVRKNRKEPSEIFFDGKWTL